MVNLEKLRLDLKNSLSRYEHSIRVAVLARKLAECYGVDLENAYVAGVLHDIAKEYDYDLTKYWVDKIIYLYSY